MPRHLINDIYEWINKIPIVPYLLSNETIVKGTGLAESTEKEDLIELNSSLIL